MRANEVFKMLDGKQREVALLGDSREEAGTRRSKLSGKVEGLPAIPVPLSRADQRDHVRKVMADCSRPSARTMPTKR